MPTLNKEYKYKISRAGVYLGDLPNVSSEFGYGQDINTGSVQLQISCNINPYVADQAPDVITMEDGVTPIQDEAGDSLTMEHAQDVVGNSDSKILIRTNNDLEVVEYSDTYPNGKTVFLGYITKWRAAFGQVGVAITALSNGADLKDYVIQPNYQIQINRLTTNGSNINWAAYSSPGVLAAGTGTFLNGQRFTPSSSYSIGKIRARLAMDSSLIFDTATLHLHSGTPSGALNPATELARVSVDFSNTSLADIDFIFDSPVAVTSGSPYYFWIETNRATIAYDNTRGVSSEGIILQIEPQWYNYVYDLYCAIYSSEGRTTANFSSYDPTNMVKAIIDDYRTQGGDVNYSGSSTDDTGITTTYNFKLATALEGLDKALELSPYNFYWYVDPATNVLYFKRTATTAAHVFSLGTHISDIELEATIENVRNVVYFSGGDTGSGSNLFKKYINQISITEQGRQRLERKSDNRVTLAGTAEKISQAILDAFDGEDYHTTITIPDAVYDITTIHTGDIVGFGAFGNFIDRLLLQVAHVDRKPHHVVLTLGIMAKRATDTLKSIEQDLSSLQTVDNPASPS